MNPAETQELMVELLNLKITKIFQVVNNAGITEFRPTADRLEKNDQQLFFRKLIEFLMLEALEVFF